MVYIYLDDNDAGFIRLGRIFLRVIIEAQIYMPAATCEIHITLLRTNSQLYSERDHAFTSEVKHRLPSRRFLCHDMLREDCG